MYRCTFQFICSNPFLYNRKYKVVLPALGQRTFDITPTCRVKIMKLLSYWCHVAAFSSKLLQRYVSISVLQICLNQTQCPPLIMYNKFSTNNMETYHWYNLTYTKVKTTSLSLFLFRKLKEKRQNNVLLLFANLMLCQQYVSMFML